MQQGICNPEFYGDLVYKFKKIIGNPNFSNPLNRIVNGSGYIHGCRNSSNTKRLFSQQLFPMPETLYTWLPCIKYKSVIDTAAVSHTKRFINTTAVNKV